MSYLSQSWFQPKAHPVAWFTYAVFLYCYLHGIVWMVDLALFDIKYICLKRYRDCFIGAIWNLLQKVTSSRDGSATFYDVYDNNLLTSVTNQDTNIAIAGNARHERRVNAESMNCSWMIPLQMHWFCSSSAKFYGITAPKSRANNGSTSFTVLQVLWIGLERDRILICWCLIPSFPLLNCFGVHDG